MTPMQGISGLSFARAFGTTKHDPKKPPTHLVNTGLSIQHLAKPEGRKREISSGKASSEAGASWWQVATAKDCDFRCSLSVLILQNSLLNSGEETLLALVSGPGGGPGFSFRINYSFPTPPRVFHLPLLVLSVLIYKVRLV